MVNSFSHKLINWYRSEHRDLPWRQTKDPYKIWLSEIILQQTRVAQGLPYYHRFTESYHTINDLAAASEQDVLRLWQGLGYYSRARNLHSCAMVIVEHYGGHFPKDYGELQKLPGIGRYTAAAIASFAFNASIPAVDGNAMRVLSRYFGLDADISAGRSFQQYFDLSASQIPLAHPNIYNQAVMEFGATVCKPKSPICDCCCLASDCYAYSTDLQMALPVKSKKVKVRDRFFSYFVVRSGDKILMRKRPSDDIWSGLYDFYLKENDIDTDFTQAVDSKLEGLLRSEKSVINQDGSTIKHLLTHQRIFSKFYTVDVSDRAFLAFKEESNLEEYGVGAVEKLPKSALIENYLQEYIF